jgi:hypothetical protein
MQKKKQNYINQEVIEWSSQDNNWAEEEHQL